MEYKFESSLMKRKSDAQEKLDKLKIDFLKQLNVLENMDNTNSDIILAKLNIKQSNKLLFKNYNVLSKNELSKFGVKKTLDNRESYFKLLEYLEVVEIKNEDEEENEKTKDKSVKKKHKKPIFTIDFTEDKIQIRDKSENKIQLNCEKNNKSEAYYKEMIGKKNANFYEYFGIKEKITIKNLRNKMDKYLNELTFEEEYKNNIPDSKSELFFFNHTLNLIYSFKELNETKFLKKIKMIKNLSNFINKVKLNKVTDELVLNYFYLVLHLEYELNSTAEMLFCNYEENNNFKNATIDLKEKTLHIHFSKIIIKDFDYYNLNEHLIHEIKYGNISLPLDEGYYSLKGYLCLREFTRKDGNLIYEKFLTSQLLEDIIHILHGKENIFSSTNVIKLFQENTFYFPIENSKFAAFSDKKNFKIYVDYKIEEDKIFKNLEFNQKIKHFIQKSFLIVNIVHEFGHSHHAFLYYYDSENNCFDSPLIKLKLKTSLELNISEGGNIFEYMLFNRVISHMNIKEIIYICNLNNFSKSLEQYRKEFLNLKNESVSQVFERESQNNDEIMEIFELYKKLAKDKKDKLENITISQGKRIINDFTFNFEDYEFSSGIENKSHYDSRRADMKY